MKDRPQLVAIGFIAVLLVLASSILIFSSTKPDIAIADNKKAEIPLPVVGSYENLKKLLQDSNNTPMYRAAGSGGMLKGATLAGAPTTAVQNDSMESASSSPVALPEYSSTNIQVAGVDEADIVKTDGTYIYQVNNRRIVISQAYPLTEMKVLNTIKFDDQNFTPRELYVDSAHLVVTGSTYTNQPRPVIPQGKIVVVPTYRTDTTVAIIYDIRNKNDIKKVREVEIEGSCVASRKIDQSLYLVTNRYIDYYCLENSTGLAPSYRDTAAGNRYVNINYPSIHYFPGDIYPNYITVAGIKLDNINTPADIQTYLGSGDNIYSSSKNLYISVGKYDYHPQIQEKSSLTEEQDVATIVYKFGLSNGNIIYSGSGEVPGTILNQFSMDEYNGFFRIATTAGTMWRNDENTSRNNIYVLNENMQIAGKLEGLAPGEKIYSTRFLGERAYMVTFKNVDPLFVIDLKDPANPKILGKLKIPGYSNYLHPYDENHIIGFGKDTVEIKGWNGSSQAFYQGLKIAIFDVTDVDHPVELSKQTIGDRGTDSEILSNHKSILFDKSKNLLAFPVTVMKVNPSNSDTQVTSYGTFTFQGAYVYSIDLVNGLQLRGTITHLNAEDYTRAGDHWYDSDKNVQRIIYINNILYTISSNMIKANDLNDLKELNTLTLQ